MQYFLIIRSQKTELWSVSQNICFYMTVNHGQFTMSEDSLKLQACSFIEWCLKWILTAKVRMKILLRLPKYKGWIVVNIKMKQWSLYGEQPKYFVTAIEIGEKKIFYGKEKDAWQFCHYDMKIFENLNW